MHCDLTNGSSPGRRCKCMIYSFPCASCKAASRAKRCITPVLSPRFEESFGTFLSYFTDSIFCCVRAEEG